MSGHMMAVEHDGNRLFYMAHVADRDEAVAAVERHSGLCGAHALTPLTAATLEHFEVCSGEIWPYLTIDRAGEVVFDNS